MAVVYQSTLVALVYPTHPGPAVHAVIDQIARRLRHLALSIEDQRARRQRWIRFEHATEQVALFWTEDIDSADDACLVVAVRSGPEAAADPRARCAGLAHELIGRCPPGLIVRHTGTDLLTRSRVDLMANVLAATPARDDAVHRPLPPGAAASSVVGSVCEAAAGSAAIRPATTLPATRGLRALG